MAENTGAAFGVFPQMRPRRAQQDREAAANAPLSLLRGWAAGTAGLPGDIEGLVRMLTPGVSNDSVLPTSEFYKEWLPGRSLNETPTGRAFTEAGSLTGGAGVGPLSKLAATGVRAGARNLAVPAQLSRQAGVIKAPGGNWLSGSVEDSLKGLKQEPAVGNVRGKELDDMIAMGLVKPEGRDAPASINNWIDKQLTRYIKNDMATPGDPIRALAEKWAVDKPAKLAEVQGRIDALGAKVAQVAGERGVPPEYLTSMRQQMIGLEKQKEQIQLRDALHIQQEDLINAGRWPSEELGASRRMAGFPEMGVVEDKAGLYGEMTPYQRAAGGWEVLSDTALNASRAGEHTRPLTASEIRRGLGSNVDKNPWLLKVPPETPVYYPERGLPEELGFNHLIDELRNATNPESGLPAELLLKYKDLPKITVPQAVERVADINAWRAAQKVEADLARANNPATQVFKEYPEQGMKWVELSSPKYSMDKLPEGWSLQEFEGSSPGSKIFGVVDSKGRLHPEAGGKQPLTPEIAYENFKRGYGTKELEDALKYEGDTMQHCVGGYCPDVAEGRSRIYSLRDSKGQPHVTVEVAPWRSSQGESLSEFEARLRQDPDRSEEAIRDIMSTPRYKDQIVQIKGKKNRAPGQEYLPFVQDFVKSGKWSDVGDLQNTGLIDARAAGKPLPGRPAFMTEDEFKAFQNELSDGTPPAEPGFAQGGMVATSPNQGYNQARVDELADSLLAELF